MDSFTPKPKKGPEAKLQDKWILYLRARGWYVKSTHGSLFQSGFPDLFCTHSTYGARWVELKVPWRKGDVFTSAQHIEFPKICANGSGIWVLTGGIDKDVHGAKIAVPIESEYRKLFSKYNWYQYL